MNYKKIIRSRELRLAILRMLSFIPDAPMLRLQYRLQTGHKLNLKEPQRLTEKMQWYKLHYHNPEMIRCVDKFDVRAYVAEKGLAHILIPCIGVYDSVDQVDWNALPSSFAMKDTLGMGGAGVVIVTDKAREDIEKLRKSAADWLKINPRSRGQGREWPYYSGKPHRLLFENYIGPKDNPGGLLDYKFFCFEGKTQFIYVMGNRKLGQKVSVSIFDRDFNPLPVTRVGDAPFTDAVKPANFEQLRQTAETLAQDFPHVRVDLYDIDGDIRFGELTFFNASGYMKYDPDQFDFDMGKHLPLITYPKS